MSQHDMRAEIECIYGDEFPGMMFMDGLDSAIIGVAVVNGNPLVAYSTEASQVESESEYRLGTNLLQSHPCLCLMNQRVV